MTDKDYTDGNDDDRSDEILSQSGEDEFSLSTEWKLIDWCETDIHSSSNGEIAPVRLSCFAHCIQLAVRDGLKDVSYLSKSLSKCLKLSRRSHKSTKIADLLDDVGKTINRSNLTRWSSEYLLIKSIIALGKETIDEITNLIDDNELKFTNNDFLVLQEAIEILEPFAEITTRIQSQSIVTASLVVPSVVHLIEQLKIIAPNVSFLKRMCLQLEKSINKRFSGIVKRLSQEYVSSDDPFSDPIYFVSAVLDPEFKFYWINQMNYRPTIESQIKQTLIELVMAECKKKR